jgi:acyl carrier protein
MLANPLNTTYRHPSRLARATWQRAWLHRRPKRAPNATQAPLQSDILLKRLDPMKTALRRILSESARLDVPPDTVADDADLYAAGLSSLATVHLMLAIEDEFDIEIPDRMLTRRLFSSIDSLAAAVSELQQAKAAT